MGSAFWAKIHGASVHVPLAMALCSWLFDLAGFALARRTVAAQLNVAGYWMMLLAGLGTFPAVASGLMMTKGEVLGHGLLLWHHLFVWPAYALLVGLAVWRAIAGRKTPAASFACYLVVAMIAAVLLGVAGYWGGEMLLSN